MRSLPWDLYPLNCRLRLSDFAALPEEDQQQYNFDDVFFRSAPETTITQWPFRAVLRPLARAWAQLGSST